MVGKGLAAQVGIPAVPLILLPTEPRPANPPLLLELLRETALRWRVRKKFSSFSDELAAQVNNVERSLLEEGVLISPRSSVHTSWVFLESCTWMRLHSQPLSVSFLPLQGVGVRRRVRVCTGALQLSTD